MLPSIVGKLLPLFLAVAPGAGAARAQTLTNGTAPAGAPVPRAKVVANGESVARPEACRGVIVGPG